MSREHFGPQMLLGGFIFPIYMDNPRYSANVHFVRSI